jgi:hypothetical protein
VKATIREKTHQVKSLEEIAADVKKQLMGSKTNFSKKESELLSAMNRKMEIERLLKEPSDESKKFDAEITVLNRY